MAHKELFTKNFTSPPLTRVDEREFPRGSMEIRTTQFQPTIRSLLLIVLATLFFANGCTMVRSESDVLGEYELKVGKGKIALKILPDRSFSETIFWPSGKLESHSGKWLWAENGISFDQLWIPSEFATVHILQADAQAEANKQPKYTEPGHWSMRAEKHCGTVTLPIFPDADVSFEMVRRFRQQS